MAYSQTPEYYAQSFSDYARRVGGEGKTIRVPATGPIPDINTGEKILTGIQQAFRLRGKYYSFLAAVRRSKKNPKWSDICEWVDQTECLIDKRETCVWFRPRANSWEAQLLDTGGELDLPAVDAGAAASLARLQSQLNADEPLDNQEGPPDEPEPDYVLLAICQVTGKPEDEVRLALLERLANDPALTLEGVYQQFRDSDRFGPTISALQANPGAAR